MISAVIPARGGSKGIPRKNIVEVCGKPLIAWTIEQALAATQIDEVIVSTDCHEIGRVAEDYGAEWILRSDDTSTDEATSESVLLEVLSVMDEIPAWMVFLQCTSPIRQPGDIDGAIRKALQTGCDSLFSARHVEGYTWTVDEAATPDYHGRERRQVQSVRRIEENGSIYVFRPDALVFSGNRLSGNIEFYEMHALDSFQVDVPGDLETLEQILPVRLQDVKTENNLR